MIGFREALDAVRAVAPEPRSEAVVLADAVGRTAAEATRVRSALPTAPSAAMDGFACRHDDAVEASPEHPVRLRLIGAARAGGPFHGRVGPGEAVAVSTGAAMPTGTNAIVVVERATREGDEVVIAAPAKTKHVRAVGEDLEAGVAAVAAGTRFGPWDVGLAAAAGHDEVSVVRRPLATVLATGPELRSPSHDLGPGEVPDSNAPLVAALVRAHGANATIGPRVGDEVEDLEAALDAALAGDDGAARPDLIVTTGGASVGRHDIVRELLLREGDLDFDGIRVRPGRPALLGRWRGRPWLALPGTPHAVAVLGSVLLRAWVEAAVGRSGDEDVSRERRAVLADPLRGVPGRTVLHLARLSVDDVGVRHVAPLVRSPASRMRDVARADALVVVPEGADLSAGDVVATRPFGRVGSPDID